MVQITGKRPREDGPTTPRDVDQPPLKKARPEKVVEPIRPIKVPEKVVIKPIKRSDAFWRAYDLEKKNERK